MSLMRRIRLSLVVGVFLPVTYVLLIIAFVNIASVAFRLLGRDTLLHAWAESLESVLSFPISWPSYIYFHYFPPDREFVAFTGFELGSIISVAAGNFVLYAIVTYCALPLYRERRV
jgi:hypothetical protein